MCASVESGSGIESAYIEKESDSIEQLSERVSSQSIHIAGLFRSKGKHRDVKHIKADAASWWTIATGVALIGIGMAVSVVSPMAGGALIATGTSMVGNGLESEFKSINEKDKEKEKPPEGNYTPYEAPRQDETGVLV